jgi:LytS/YehU family sensor histidine kinase
MPFLLGSRIHFFQSGIMLAGVVGGPLSGLITGLIGGLYVATVRADPTIIIGNGLLGLFTGILSLRLRPVLAGSIAWVFVQAPWVYVTGTFIFRVPAMAMQVILIMLTVEAIICACIVDVLVNHFRLRGLLANQMRSIHV